MEIRTIHGDKLKALLDNNKLPYSDKENIEIAIDKYQSWRNNLEKLQGDTISIVSQAVKLLNDYKNFIEINLIFCSKEDFLYRQKGQLKLDNTIIEEFLPLVISKIFASNFKNTDIIIGPSKCITGIRFDTSIAKKADDSGMILKYKDQDFAISRPLFIQSSHSSSFVNSIIRETNISYLACECKTNLDKTMFQEATATAFDLKLVIPSAKYILLCEWLDMIPINSKTTAIDEIIILRKARRINETIRHDFSSASGRKLKINEYCNYISSNPFVVDTFMRLIKHIEQLLNEVQNESEILSKGYF
ncbi:MAG: Bpu10I family restriction endonuclease [Deltaproteobacteria bacterium]|jgi:hypothetical protein|nr:Bpu10I family restriction endonuclease [Deltaproteobacteria bacterium]